MKKIFILGGTIILSLIMTFLFAELFSLYHFKDVPTLLTSSYLISIFSIIEYVLLTLTYIILKIKNKVKITGKQILARILIFIALLLTLWLIVVLNIDWLNWYTYSSPFYINVIVKCLKYLIPSIGLIIISIFLLRKNK